MPNLRLLLWLLAALWGATLAGCGQSRRAIEGTVTVNGVPMDLGMITFNPVDPAGGQTSVGGKVTNGSYQLDATRGPLPGKYRVEIYWSKKTGKQVPNSDGGMQDEMIEGLPEKYNKNTELTTEITSWTSKASFDLTP
jgi:hypothetical protein